MRSSPLKFENLRICSFLNVVHIPVLQTSSEPLIIKACALQTSQQCKYGQTAQLSLVIVSCVHKYGQEMGASFTVFSQSSSINLKYDYSCMYATFSSHQGDNGGNSGVHEVCRSFPVAFKGDVCFIWMKNNKCEAFFFKATSASIIHLLFILCCFLASSCSSRTELTYFPC